MFSYTISKFKQKYKNILGYNFSTLNNTKIDT